MKRRELITLLGPATASLLSLPYAAQGHQPASPMIGFITAGPLAALTQQIAAFRERIKETGYIEGQNVGRELES